MEGEIINRVASGVLEGFDLEDYDPAGPRILVDVAQWLDEGLVLREKAFREALKNHDWAQYQNAYVAVYCSTDAIIPAWATILVASHLQGVAKKVVAGKIEDIDTEIYAEVLSSLDYEPYRDKPVIIKGCARKPVPDSAYLMAIAKLQPVAKSIMYGEACSAVPLYKRKP